MNFKSLRIKIIGSVVLSSFLLSNGSLPVRADEVSIQNLLRNRIESAGKPAKIFVDQEPVYSAIVLPIFYERRVYRPGWDSEAGLSPRIESLLEFIRQAEQHGLRSADYHLAKIEMILSDLARIQESRQPPNPRLLVDLDLLLSDAFLILGSHLLAGRIDPQTVDPQWHVNRREGDLAELLATAIDSNQVGDALRSLLPAQPEYEQLTAALARYRTITENGGWPAVAAGPKLQQGDRGPRVAALKQRLALENFLENVSPTDEDLFDDDVDQALRKFQMQNGLEVDGVLGRQTLQALNISAQARVRQLLVNLERWRWLPRYLGPRYLLVNIAGFHLEVVENSQLVMEMRVIAGRPYRQTPVFSGSMTYLVFNPSWTVPDKIARKDILPKIKKDPAFAVKQKIKVFKGWGASTVAIDPLEMDWRAVSAHNFRYRFKQDPGPLNALGRVKFMFPNQFDVYLHDTPARELFGKTRRDFSSGCIRIEKPLELTEYLLQNHPDWTPAKIRSTLEADLPVEQTVKLPAPVPVHILYWTVWIGKDGQIYFGQDIYGRDKVLDAALKQPPPGA